MNWMVIENIATMLIAVGTVAVLYAMGAGGWSFFGLLVLLNLNTSEVKQ